MDENEVIIVQETEYTGAGKHLTAQLTFARENGIEIRRGNPSEQVPGRNIIIPENPSLIGVKEIESDKLRKSYIKNCVKNNDLEASDLSREEIDFLAEEVNRDTSFVKTVLDSI